MATQRQPQNTTTETEADPLAGLLNRKVTYKPFMADEPITISAGIVLKYFAKPTKSGQTCPPEQAEKFVKLCESRALNPWEGDAFITGFDTRDGPLFNLVTAHQAFLKRAEVHPEYDGMKSGVTVKVKATNETIDIEGDYVDNDTQILVGGWARVFFKQRTIPTYRRLKLATFSTGYSRWNADPAGMICKCAEADALRSSFPTKLGGLYLREEMESTNPAKEREKIDMPRGTDEPAEPETTPLEDHVDEMLAGKTDDTEDVVQRQDFADDVCKKMDEATTLKELRDCYTDEVRAFIAAENDEPARQILAKKDTRKHSLLRDEADYLATDLHMTLEQLQTFAKKQKIADLDQMDIKQLERLVAALTKALSEQEGT